MPGMRPTSNASLRAPPERRRTRGINACSLRWYYVPRGTDQMRVSRVAPTSVVGAIGGTHEHHSSDSDDSKRYDPPRSAQPGRQSHLTDVCCSSRSVRKDCVTQSASSVDRQRTHLAGWRCKKLRASRKSSTPLEKLSRGYRLLKELPAGCAGCPDGRTGSDRAAGRRTPFTLRPVCKTCDRHGRKCRAAVLNEGIDSQLIWRFKFKWIRNRTEMAFDHRFL